MECIRCGTATSRRTRKFCSVECYRASQKRESEERLCINCGVAFNFTPPGGGHPRSGKYCSRSCGISFSNRLSPKRVKSPRTQPKDFVSVFDTRTVGHYRSKGSNNFGVAARGEAKRYAKLIGLDRSCIICGYTFYLHLAHVKPLSQFDDSEPYLDGYQILPRYGADIQWITSTENPSLSNVSLLQNPINTELVLVGELSHIEKYIITDLSGKIIKQQVLRGSKIDFDSSAGLYNLFLLGGSEIIAIKFIKADF